MHVRYLCYAGISKKQALTPVKWMDVLARQSKQVKSKSFSSRFSCRLPAEDVAQIKGVCLPAPWRQRQAYLCELETNLVYRVNQDKQTGLHKETLSQNKTKAKTKTKKKKDVCLPTSKIQTRSGLTHFKSSKKCLHFWIIVHSRCSQAGNLYQPQSQLPSSMLLPEASVHVGSVTPAVALRI